MRKIFVTGIGTDVGKTVVTSNFVNAIVDHMKKMKKNVSLYETAVGFKWMVELMTDKKVNFWDC